MPVSQHGLNQTHATRPIVLLSKAGQSVSGRLSDIPSDVSACCRVVAATDFSMHPPARHHREPHTERGSRTVAIRGQQSEANRNPGQACRRSHRAAVDAGSIPAASHNGRPQMDDGPRDPAGGVRGPGRSSLRAVRPRRPARPPRCVMGHRAFGGRVPGLAEWVLPAGGARPDRRLRRAAAPGVPTIGR